jgi:hypothetical protein
MWKSVAQARWGHSSAGKKALGGNAAVAEWDSSTPEGSLAGTKGSKEKKDSRMAEAFRKARR